MNDMPATAPAAQSPAVWGVDWNAVDALCHARFGDPFAILGPPVVGGFCEVRAILPGA